MFRFVLITGLSFLLFACASHTIVQQDTIHEVSPSGTRIITQTEITHQTSYTELAYLQQGKRYFIAGYFKRAMYRLLPLAVDGNKEAQYAVGYLYYYGYGVTQDTAIGCFWINRSAEQGYPPAIIARNMVNRSVDREFSLKDTLQK